MPDFSSPINIPDREAECLGTLSSPFRGRPLLEKDIRRALLRPIWPIGAGGAVFDRIRPGESVCIVVSDHTRKTAADRILPILFAGLTENQCRLDDMFLLVASGIHRHPTPDEMRTIIGAEVAATFQKRIFFHDPDDDANLVEVGRTPRGHAVRLNRRAVEADRVILLGAALYHYHAGFGGGRKALVPGLAARTTISYNHSLTLDPEQDRIHPGVGPGLLDGNPVAEEMLAGARLHPPDFIINTVLTPDGALAGVFAGEMNLAHRAACQLVEQIDRIDLKRAADLAIASAGAATNWIQSHKAFFNAHRAVGEGGLVILEAPCPEGLGNEQFRHWVTRPSIGEIYSGLRRTPEILGQTALSTRSRAPRTILITRMNAKDRSDLGLRTAPDLETALRLALAELAARGIRRPAYYLMPSALSLVPFVAP